MFRIRTYDRIAARGLATLPAGRFEVGPSVLAPHALLLRSHSLHGESLPVSVVAVARAGAGVNNIPVDDYSHRGVVVFNTPGANANAVKELVTDLGRPHDNLYEVALWADMLRVEGNELFYAYMVDNQAIVIPETIDAIRALTARVRTGAESIAMTNAALGISGSLI